LANIPVQDSSGWLTILRKLGITGLQRWFLSDTVIPVAIVDSEVLLTAAASTPLVGVPASAGELAVPAANTRLATTGALPAGNYTMVIWISSTDLTANSIRIRRRNAADAADIWGHRLTIGGPTPPFVVTALRLVLAQNELVVVENVLVGSAGSVYQASIFVSAG
jgi:hypothetical protein